MPSARSARACETDREKRPDSRSPPLRRPPVRGARTNALRSERPRFRLQSERGTHRRARGVPRSGLPARPRATGMETVPRDATGLGMRDGAGSGYRSGDNGSKSDARALEAEITSVRSRVIGSGRDRVERGARWPSADRAAGRSETLFGLRRRQLFESAAPRRTVGGAHEQGTSAEIAAHHAVEIVRVGQAGSRRRGLFG
jgi:hypothetical protein